MIVGSTAIFNFLFIIFAPLLIDLLTAGRYADAYPFARIFAVYNILFAVFSIIENIVIGYGFTKQTLYVKVLGAGLAVGIYYLMIKFLGNTRIAGSCGFGASFRSRQSRTSGFFR